MEVQQNSNESGIERNGDDRPIAIRVSNRELDGLLFIGDPHLEGRTPGFRKDDYPTAVLRKVEWCLEYAAVHRLQPVILGDLFDKPRDNPNWLMSRLLDLFGRDGIPAIYGNHDCANPEIDVNDSLTLLAKAGAIYLLDDSHVWACMIDGRSVFIGGSPYRKKIPSKWTISEREMIVDGADNKLTLDLKSILWIWLTHHDLVFPSEDQAVVTNLFAIDGIDYVINGHIHKRATVPVIKEKTTWVNPGNISRRSRGDAIRGHCPSVLKMDITSQGEWLHWIEVPHSPSEQVFYDLAALKENSAKESQSLFVQGLSTLQSRKTQSGAGLMEFIKQNVTQFEREVANEIMILAQITLDEFEANRTSIGGVANEFSADKKSKTEQ